MESLLETRQAELGRHVSSTLNLKTVPALKAICRTRTLRVGGKKSDLVERLTLDVLTKGWTISTDADLWKDFSQAPDSPADRKSKMTAAINSKASISNLDDSDSGRSSPHNSCSSPSSSSTLASPIPSSASSLVVAGSPTGSVLSPNQSVEGCSHKKRVALLVDTESPILKRKNNISGQSEDSGAAGRRPHLTRRALKAHLRRTSSSRRSGSDFFDKKDKRLVQDANKGKTSTGSKLSMRSLLLMAESRNREVLEQDSDKSDERRISGLDEGSRGQKVQGAECPSGKEVGGVKPVRVADSTIAAGRGGIGAEGNAEAAQDANDTNEAEGIVAGRNAGVTQVVPISLICCSSLRRGADEAVVSSAPPTTPSTSSSRSSRKLGHRSTVQQAAAIDPYAFDDDFESTASHASVDDSESTASRTASDVSSSRLRRNCAKKTSVRDSGRKTTTAIPTNEAVSDSADYNSDSDLRIEGRFTDSASDDSDSDSLRVCPVSPSVVATVTAAGVPIAIVTTRDSQSENKDDYDDGYNDDDDEDDGSKSLSLSSTVRPEVEWISITDDDEVF